MTDELFTVTEFCKNTKLSKATFYLLLKEGKAPQIIKVGKRTLISRKAFEKWIADLETATANDNRTDKISAKGGE